MIAILYNLESSTVMNIISGVISSTETDIIAKDVTFKGINRTIASFIIVGETTLNIGDVINPSDFFNLDDYKRDRIELLSGYYESELNSEFTSNALGTPVTFGYDQIAQDRFTKKASIISLNSSITSVDWGSKSNGFITATREQFINILNDAATHETNLAFKFLYAQAYIQNSTNKDQVDTIVASW